MKDMNMVIAGFGGQGVLFTGRIIATAGLLDGLEVSWLPSYGPEMRGGTANCSICLSQRPIGSPLVTTPDVLVAMNGPSYEKFKDTLAPDAKVFVDSSLVTQAVLVDDTKATLYQVPATRLSNEKELQSLANMIILGKVLKETQFSSLETVEKALKECVPPRNSHLLEPNLRAITLGMTL